MAQTDRQTSRHPDNQTNGHGDSMTKNYELELQLHFPLLTYEQSDGQKTIFCLGKNSSPYSVFSVS